MAVCDQRRQACPLHALAHAVAWPRICRARQRQGSPSPCTRSTPTGRLLNSRSRPLCYPPGLVSPEGRPHASLPPPLLSPQSYPPPPQTYLQRGVVRLHLCMQVRRQQLPPLAGSPWLLRNDLRRHGLVHPPSGVHRWCSRRGAEVQAQREAAWRHLRLDDTAHRPLLLERAQRHGHIHSIFGWYRRACDEARSCALVCMCLRACACARAHTPRPPRRGRPCRGAPPATPGRLSRGAASGGS